MTTTSQQPEQPNGIQNLADLAAALHRIVEACADRVHANPRCEAIASGELWAFKAILAAIDPTFPVPDLYEGLDDTIVG